jgi:hypothetical protein
VVVKSRGCRSGLVRKCSKNCLGQLGQVLEYVLVVFFSRVLLCGGLES